MALCRALFAEVVVQAESPNDILHDLLRCLACGHMYGRFVLPRLLKCFKLAGQELAFCEVTLARLDAPS